ncbi:hypothetical protein G5B41_17615 [bacterium SGD-2]|nr:hypothetical protein [bacterium SGD-2]
MTSTAQQPTGLPTFSSYDAGMERLDQTISMLRALAAAPQVFDHINPSDRQNLLLTALELAESAQAQLSPSK